MRVYQALVRKEQPEINALPRPHRRRGVAKPILENLCASRWPSVAEMVASVAPGERRPSADGGLEFPPGGRRSRIRRRRGRHEETSARGSCGRICASPGETTHYEINALSRPHRRRGFAKPNFGNLCASWLPFVTEMVASVAPGERRTTADGGLEFPWAHRIWGPM